MSDKDQAEFKHDGPDNTLASHAVKHFGLKSDDAGFDKLQEVLDEHGATDAHPWRNKKRFMRRVKAMEARRAAKSKD